MDEIEPLQKVRFGPEDLAEMRRHALWLIRAGEAKNFPEAFLRAVALFVEIEEVLANGVEIDIRGMRRRVLFANSAHQALVVELMTDSEP